MLGMNQSLSNGLLIVQSNVMELGLYSYLKVIEHQLSKDRSLSFYEKHE